MKMKKICTVLLLGAMVLGGCGHQNNEANNEASEEVYYCDIVNESVSKYPELKAPDIVIGWDGFGPMIVSPYASDDVVKAAAHVIYETQITTYCFGNPVYGKFDDYIEGMSYEDTYKIVRSGVDNARHQADLFDKELNASIKKDAAINISSDGEYYYILDMDNFEKSADVIQDSIDRQSEVIGSEKIEDSTCYFWYDDFKDYVGGYRGPRYSIYLDAYSPGNKIYEYFYWTKKNESVDIYSELYRSQIYDFEKISEKPDKNENNIKRLTCTTWAYSYDSDPDLKSIYFEYKMETDNFDLTEAIGLAYEVYTNVGKANIKHNTHRITEMDVSIDNFTWYEKEYNKVWVSIPLDEKYSLKEFEKIIKDHIETAIDSWPE